MKRLFPLLTNSRTINSRSLWVMSVLLATFLFSANVKAWGDGFDILTKAQLKKIIVDNSKNGLMRPVRSEVTRALGLTRKTEVMTIRRDSFNDPHKNTHSFWELKNGNYLFATADTEFAYVYYVDQDLNLIDAVINDKKHLVTKNKTPRPGLDAELRFFCSVADQLLTFSVCNSMEYFKVRRLALGKQFNQINGLVMEFQVEC